MFKKGCTDWLPLDGVSLNFLLENFVVVGNLSSKFKFKCILTRITGSFHKTVHEFITLSH